MLVYSRSFTVIQRLLVTSIQSKFIICRGIADFNKCNINSTEIRT